MTELLQVLNEPTPLWVSLALMLFVLVLALAMSYPE